MARRGLLWLGGWGFLDLERGGRAGQGQVAGVEEGGVSRSGRFAG